GGLAPTGFGMPPMAPAAPAPGGVSVGGARIPGVPVGATSWAAPIPLDDASAALESDPNPERRIRPLWMVEEETIEEAIRLCQGNITRAAALLEINPCTIYRRRQKKRATA
ncbi:helix-turn-helix domain-containing protein, partial [Nitrospirillum viridazoti]